MRIEEVLSGRDGAVFRFIVAAIFGALVSVTLALVVWVSGVMFAIYGWSPKAFWFLLLVPPGWGLVTQVSGWVSGVLSEFVIQLVRLIIFSLFCGLLIAFVFTNLRAPSEWELWPPAVIGAFCALPIVWGVLGIFQLDAMIGGARFIFNVTTGRADGEH